MNRRQRSFVRELVALGNGAAAARAAGYSPRYARQMAYRLTGRGDVQAAIDKEEALRFFEQQAARRKATDMLLAAFEKTASAEEKRQCVDALCRLHGLI
jgi:phage terminase small subunit